LDFQYISRRWALARADVQTSIAAGSRKQPGKRTVLPLRQKTASDILVIGYRAGVRQANCRTQRTSAARSDRPYQLEIAVNIGTSPQLDTRHRRYIVAPAYTGHTKSRAAGLLR